MRHHLLFVLILVKCINCYAQKPSDTITNVTPSIQRLDDKNGFQDALFGASIKTFKGLYLHRRSGDDAEYYNKSSQIKVGNYKIYKPTYIFYKGKLLSIFGWTGDASNTSGIKKILIAAYGLPKTDNISDNWNGKKVIMFLANMPTGRIFTIGSVALSKEREAARAIVDKKAASDL